MADLTSETFVEAIGSYASYDPRRGSPRAWVFGIARRVHARHTAAIKDGQTLVGALSGHRPLPADEIDELAAKIDAQRASGTTSPPSTPTSWT